MGLQERKKSIPPSTTKLFFIFFTKVLIVVLNSDGTYSRELTAVFIVEKNNYIYKKKS